MGADIHWVLEFKPVGTDNWIGIFADMFTPSPPPNISKDSMFSHGIIHPLLGQRNYDFFAALAGVRGEGPEPNGIPNNVSDLTHYLIDDWGNDGHSHGYLPAHEFCKIADEHYLQGSLYNESVKHRLKGVPENTFYPMLLLDLYPTLDNQEGEYRVVFWFDN